MKYWRIHQAGFSLIEVVVTMFIMSVGLLGMAALQTSSTKNGLDIAQRSQVTWMVNELVERMRSNPDALSDPLNNGYTTISNGVLNCTASPARRCANNAAGAAQTCTANQLAEFDVWDVFCGQGDTGDPAVIANTQDSLSLTAVSITCDDATCDESSDYTVSISWDARAVQSSQTLVAAGKVDENKAQSISMTMRP